MNKKITPFILVFLSCLLFMGAITLVLNVNYFKLSNKTEIKENKQNQIKEESINTTVETSDESSSGKESVDNKNNETIDTETNNKQESIFKKEMEEIAESNSNKQESNTKEETITIKEEPVINTENNTSNNSDETVNNIDNTTDSIEVINDEIAVINYFNEQEKIINESTNQNDSSLREKAKNAFVTVIDFIFYDKEIKGYTFSELTTKAKLEVIEIALSIDDKIDKYFPDYKDVIKEKYTSIKGKLAVEYLEFTSTLCETVGTDVCNQAKEDFNTMKESFNFTWQFIKELASNGSNKVKEFYESWRDA